MLAFSVVAPAAGQVPTQQRPCVPATGDLQSLAARLDRVWSTRTTLLVCDGSRVPFGSQATPGVVYFVPDQARALGFDSLGVVYIIAHEWGHQVQFQRQRIANAFSFSQQREFNADCLAGYFIGATRPTASDTERRLMAAAAAIGDDRLLHDARLSGPFGNVIDQYLVPNAHGNAKGRAYFVQMGYRDGRQRGIVSCAVITPNLKDVAAASDDGRSERLAKAQADARRLASAVSMYSAHMGALPPTLAALTIPVMNTMGHAAGPFLSRIPAPPEGWTPYRYRPAGGEFTVTTEGDGTQVSVP
jgi:hypothetical protein